jgi:hypothetical protein
MDYKLSQENLNKLQKFNIELNKYLNEYDLNLSINNQFLDILSSIHNDIISDLQKKNKELQEAQK